MRLTEADAGKVFSPHKGALSLRYARSWEKNLPPAREFSARFDIRP